jgi:hypothetical protein
MPSTTTNRLIHIGRILIDDRRAAYLLLRKKSDTLYGWYYVKIDGTEEETPVNSTTVEEAIRLARIEWREEDFRTVICGFRYTLPERDEHGMNALYHQMAASLASLNGQYLDEEVGHLCIVHNASLEARNLWQKYR